MRRITGWMASGLKINDRQGERIFLALKRFAAGCIIQRHSISLIQLPVSDMEVAG